MWIRQKIVKVYSQKQYFPFIISTIQMHCYYRSPFVLTNLRTRETERCCIDRIFRYFFTCRKGLLKGSYRSCLVLCDSGQKFRKLASTVSSDGWLCIAIANRWLSLSFGEYIPRDRFLPTCTICLLCISIYTWRPHWVA